MFVVMQTLNISVETFSFADLQLRFAKMCKHKHGVQHRRDANEEDDRQLWRCKCIPGQCSTCITAGTTYRAGRKAGRDGLRQTRTSLCPSHYRKSMPSYLHFIHGELGQKEYVKLSFYFCVHLQCHSSL